VINNECGGEDSNQEPGGPGESRRIKAFKFFCRFFGVSLIVSIVPYSSFTISFQNKCKLPRWNLVLTLKTKLYSR